MLNVTDIQKDVFPFAPLRLVARYGISVFHLQGVEVWVLLHLFIPLALLGEIGIVLHHRFEERVVLFSGHSRHLGVQHVEVDLRVELDVVIAMEQQHIAETEAVHLLVSAYAQHFHELAVGEKVEPVEAVDPEIIVFGDHQQVAARQLFLPVEHRVADAVVVGVDPLVGARNDNRLLDAVTAVSVGNLVDQFGAVDAFDVGKRIRRQAGKIFGDVELQGIAQAGGIGEDARRFGLPNDVGEDSLRHVKRVRSQDVGVECGTELLFHGRQLRGVAQQQQPASLPRIDIAYQVVEQAPRAEDRIAVGLITDHRRFVYNE